MRPGRVVAQALEQRVAERPGGPAAVGGRPREPGEALVDDLPPLDETVHVEEKAGARLQMSGRGSSRPVREQRSGVPAREQCGRAAGIQKQRRQASGARIA